MSYNDFAIKKFLKSEFARMPCRGNGRLLDLGCGARPYFNLYGDRFDHCVSGDYDARTRVDLRFDAARLPFPNATFDVVLMSEVIEHVADADVVLSEISRILKPGGILLITWPFNYMMHEVPHDYSRLTEFGIVARLSKTELQIENIFRRGNAIILSIVLFEFFLNGILELFARSPVIGIIFQKLKQIFLLIIFDSLYRFYLFVTWHSSYSSQSPPGSNLKGFIGHMSLWNLGYCARVRKSGVNQCA